LPRVRRIVLVGFMGSGKSSVGPILARLLGWDFVDVDERVERSEGRSVAAIFAESGEGHFRAAEARAVQETLSRDQVVLAPGGGWAALPGRLRALPDGTRSIWLKVSPEEAVRRAGHARGSRPLLAGSDPLARARELLAQRDPYYAQSDLEVDTEGRSVEDVAARILDLLGLNLGTQPAVEKR
jgi:shikimate kinase